MYKVLVGAISPEGEHLLTSYLDKFMPDYQIEPLKAVGIKGRMKNHAVRQDVVMVILDESLYQACVGFADDILALPKVHRYETDDGLKQFLIGKFGVLDGVDDSPGTIPPDMLLENASTDQEEEAFVPKTADIYKDTATTVPPDQLGGMEVDEADLDNMSVGDDTEEVKESDTSSEVIDKLNSQVQELKDKLASSEMLVRNLTLQLEEKSSGADDDMSALIGRIRELEKELSEKNAQLSNSDNESFVNLGKVARAEQVLQQFDELRGQLKSLGEEKDAVTTEREALSKQLEEAQTQLEGLKAQVDELAPLRVSVDEKAKRITELEGELTARVESIAELEERLKEHETVVSELKKLQSESVVLQEQIDADKAKLKRLDELEDELSEKRLTVDNLKVDISSRDDTITSLNAECKRVQGELTAKGVELDQLREELDSVNKALKVKAQELEDAQNACKAASDEASSSASQNAELLESVTTLGQRITDLTSEVQSKTVALDEVTQKLSDAHSEIEMMSGQVTSLQEEVSSKSDEIANLTTQLEEAKSTLEDARASSETGMSDLQSQLAGRSEELEGLRTQLTTKDSTISKLTSDISSLHEQLAAKTQEIAQLNESLSASNQKLLDAVAAGDNASINADTQRQALDKVLTEKTDLENKLVEAEKKRLELESRIKALEGELAQERNFGGRTYDTNVSLTAENEKLTNTVQQLQADLVKAEADAGQIARLESELLEERRRSATLQSSIDVLNRTSSTEKTSDLRIELVRTKQELEDLKSSTVSADEAESLRAELTESRERAAKLELELVAKDGQISSITSGVFAQLGNIAIPKGAYDLRLPALGAVSDKLMCVVSGSEESTASVYQVLRAACNAQRDKRVLVVDLVTDSSVDKEFGIKKIVSPIDWLKGEAPIRGFPADTRYGNVKVMSTALAYINDLFLLTVDWSSRFRELADFSADTVVLYVGCLNNLTAKVLFDMFSKSMRSYVIVKATPVNLRTTILNLTGFKEVSPYVTVECVNFSDTSSAAMYQRLVAKYKAQVLRDTEVLQL